MRLKTWILVLLHIVLWSAVGFYIYISAIALQEKTVIKILGSTEQSLSLPVFAQFIFTQTLFFDRPFLASELRIPMYLPNDALPIKISLYQDGKLVSWWRYPLSYEEKKEGSHIAHLPFIVPLILQGKMELRFDGSSIVHNLQDHAPRLFTETFDGAYPHGNYRIAENEKKGDIALEFMEQKATYKLLTEKMQENVLGGSVHILRWVSVLLLLGCFPGVIIRPFFRNH